MPKTMEVACPDPDCALDMVTLHFSYDMPDDVTAGDFSCPYCGQEGTLVELTPPE